MKEKSSKTPYIVKPNLAGGAAEMRSRDSPGSWPLTAGFFQRNGDERTVPLSPHSTVQVEIFSFFRFLPKKHPLNFTYIVKALERSGGDAKQGLTREPATYSGVLSTKR